MFGNNLAHGVHWLELHHHGNIRTQSDGSEEHPAGELSEASTKERKKENTY